MFSPVHYIREYVHVLRHLDLDRMGAVADALHLAYRSGRTIFAFGNGGSAANASHFAADLAKLVSPGTGRRLKAVALNEGVSAITAIANDGAYDQIFEEQLRTFMQPGDVLVGLSTSGASRNVLRAIEFGRRCGAVTVGITGSDGTPLADRVHHALRIPSASVQQVEDATMVVAHVLCLELRQRCTAGTVDRPAELAGVELVGPPLM
jgi:D-sedoheptulose 7-phosphate isomerase